MINIILALLKYYRSKSSFLTFCAGYRWHYVCNDVSIWFAYKWSKMSTKKLAPCLKRFSIFQLTKYHQKISVFTKCPRDPQKWTIAPALDGPLFLGVLKSNIKLNQGLVSAKHDQTLGIWFDLIWFLCLISSVSFHATGPRALLHKKLHLNRTPKL